MQAYWTDKKPDGTPITDGRLCRIVDPEDGSTPIRVYGQTEAEVIRKIERTMMTAQAALSRVKQPPNGNGNRPAEPAKNPAILSADEILVLTQQQENPAKSPEANARLADHHRAVKAQERENFKELCKRWALEHPEVYDHPANQTLLMQKALITTGNDMNKVTAEILDLCYRDLQALGTLVTESDAPATPPQESEPVRQGGSLEVVPARPRNGVVSATSHRTAGMSAPQQPQWKPKYTLEEISKLATKETNAILRGTHPRITKKDYEEACEFYWPSQARAKA